MISEAIEELKGELEKPGGGGRLLPATQEDLEEASRFGFPNVLLDLYRENAPDVTDGRVELSSGQRTSSIQNAIRIWSIQNAITENRDYVPGAHLFPLGYVVFASNIFGDAYCVDTVHVNQSGDLPVVLFPHDEFPEEVSLEDAEQYRLKVAANLEDFLRQVARRTLIDAPRYE